MKQECEKFECMYISDSTGCTKYGPNTDCTIRRCLYACSHCKNKCKHRKGKIGTMKSVADKA